MTLSELDKFNNCVYWSLCTENGYARVFVHAKLLVHKTVTVDANFHCLIYNVVIDITLPIYFVIF